MAIIASGSGAGELLKVDPTSLAARTTLYGPDGRPLGAPADLGEATVHGLIRQSATTGAGATVFAIRNSHLTRKIHIEQIRLQLSFDGTGAATLMRYELIKGITVTAFSAGTLITPALKRTSMGALMSEAEFRFLDTGLTLTGLAVEGIIGTFTHGRMTPSATVQAGSGDFIINFGDHPLELEQNQVLALRNGPSNTSVIGDTAIISVDLTVSAS